MPWVSLDLMADRPVSQAPGHQSPWFVVKGFAVARRPALSALLRRVADGGMAHDGILVMAARAPGYRIRSFGWTPFSLSMRPSGSRLQETPHEDCLYW